MIKMKKIIKILVCLIIIIWILINILSIFNISFFGIRIYKIVSGSMEPNLRINDIIIIKKENTYNIDDIVTFKEDNHYTTHRIIEKSNGKITTKGDNNDTNDNSITEDEIIGKMVYRFKILGMTISLLENPISWIAIFAVGIFFIIAIPVKIKNGRHSK